VKLWVLWVEINATTTKSYFIDNSQNSVDISAVLKVFVCKEHIFLWTYVYTSIHANLHIDTMVNRCNIYYIH